MRGDGRVFQRGRAWWISYYAPKDGRSVEHREPALVSDRAGAPPRPARTEAEARRILKLRLREVAVHKAGVRPFQGPSQERVPFEDLLQAVERDYEVRGLHSLASLRSHLAHVRRYFGNDKALAVTTPRLRDFVAHQQSEDVAPASIQRQLEAIRRAFRLAAESNLLTFTPVIPTISVKNARQGFLSRADFDAAVGNLADVDLADFTEWSWWTGMRKGESARLTWEALDRETWTLRLHARDAKTGHGRALALVGPLREIIERRIAARRLDCPLIFHRAGEPVAEFRKAWASAVKRAGLTGVRFHDLRRIAIRNMVRGGTDPAVAMKDQRAPDARRLRPLQHRLRGGPRPGHHEDGGLRGRPPHRPQGGALGPGPVRNTDRTRTNCTGMQQNEGRPPGPPCLHPHEGLDDGVGSGGWI